MLARVNSYGTSGLEAYPIVVEVDVARGLPSTIIVGLPDSAIKESKERVRSAIKNSDYKFAPQRITVNLSPADIKKEGPSFDLAMGLGILAASNQIDSSRLEKYVVLGELSLNGDIQPVRGVLSIAAAIAKNRFDGLIVPFANAKEAAMASNIDVFPAKTLRQVIHFLGEPETIAPFKIDAPSLFGEANRYDIDFSDVKGQTHVKHGLEVAAAGGHNCLLVGTQYNRWNLKWW